MVRCSWSTEAGWGVEGTGFGVEYWSIGVLGSVLQKLYLKVTHTIGPNLHHFSTPSNLGQVPLAKRSVPQRQTPVARFA